MGYCWFNSVKLDERLPDERLRVLMTDDAGGACACACTLVELFKPAHERHALRGATPARHAGMCTALSDHVARSRRRTVLMLCHQLPYYKMPRLPKCCYGWANVL